MRGVLIPTCALLLWSLFLGRDRQWVETKHPGFPESKTCHKSISLPATTASFSQVVENRLHTLCVKSGGPSPCDIFKKKGHEKKNLSILCSARGGILFLSKLIRLFRRKKNFLHKSAWNKVWGLTWITRSRSLERDAAVGLLGYAFCNLLKQKKKLFVSWYQEGGGHFRSPWLRILINLLWKILTGTLQGGKKIAYLFSKGNIFFYIYIQIMMSVWPFSSLIFTRSAFS